MRRAVFLLVLLTSGCVPDFGSFTVIEPGDDGGPRADAGPGDAGDGDDDAGPGPVDGGADAGPTPTDAGFDAGGGGTGAALQAAASCDDVVSGALLTEEFDVTPTTFTNLAGSFRVEAGDLVVEGGSSSNAIVQSTSQFNDDLVSCADIELPAIVGGSTLHNMSQNLRGLDHGVTCFVDAAQDRVVMFSLDPGGNTLVAQQSPSWLGEAVELRMLIYLRGTVARCEVQNLGTDEITVLDGAYGGLMMPVRVNFDGMATNDIRIHRVVAGPPSAAARAALP